MSRQQMSRKSPLVSVIIPTHNRADMLYRAVDSVLNQSFANLEVIVVDDGSTDDTQRRIETYADPRIRYFKHDESKGASAARNTGIRQARGKYIAFLDDDDEWLPTKLEKQIPVLQQAPKQVGLVYCWMDYYEDGKLIYQHHPMLRGYVFDQVLDRQRLGGCPTLLVRREVVEDVGGFDESLLRGNDGDFIRRVCLDYEVELIPEVLVRVHIGHQHERITSRWDADGIWYAIKSQTIKLTKFEDELPKYPTQTANILASIGFYYSLFPDWKNCIRFLLQAIVRSATSRTVHAYIRKSLKNFVKSMR